MYESGDIYENIDAGTEELQARYERGEISYEEFSNQWAAMAKNNMDAQNQAEADSLASGSPNGAATPGDGGDVTVTPKYLPKEVYWGGGSNPWEMADKFSGMALSRMNVANGAEDWALGQAKDERGAQAWENQELSDREAMARGWDQQGALDLSREAAMGQAPSEAAFMMQQGLDQGMAGQTSLAGSARGAAGIAMAQGNAAANVANMQGQAFTEAGRLRAQEMAQARGLYGGLAGQMREQDLQRLGMGNQMSQYNASLNDQYRLGMMGSAAQYGQVGQGWYNGGMAPYNTVAGLQSQYEANKQGAVLQQDEMAAAQDQAATDRQDGWVRSGIQGGATLAASIPTYGAGAGAGSAAGDYVAKRV